MARTIPDGEEPKDQRVPIMMTAEMVRRVDAWRAQQGSPIPSRGEAIRQLVEIGLSEEADAGFQNGHGGA